MSASLIGRLGSSTFRLSTTAVSMSLTGSRFSSESAPFAIAMIHCDNRIASAITVGLFATGVAASVLLIASHDRPFSGAISVGPEPLLQVMPDASR